MNQGENIKTENVENEEDIIYEENGTFCRLGSTRGGFLEVDLKITKQKGVEERLISLNSIGFDENQQITKAEVLFFDEELFNKLKAFIAKLNWND